MVLFGDWGVGKTHTMRHIEYIIDHNPDFPAKVVFRELPNIERKSKFDVAHGALLDALGFDTVVSWLQDYQRTEGDLRNQFKNWTQSEDIAKAFESMLLGRGDGCKAAWNWLRGLNLSAAEKTMADVSSRLTETSNFIHVLKVLGRLCQKIEEKQLIFMIDEAAKLVDVTDNDCHRNWMDAFRLTADDDNTFFGMIISASFQNIEDMPPCLEDRQVLGRFGENQYIELTTLDPPDTKEFIEAILEQWIDDTKRSALLNTFEAEKDGERMSNKLTFPFTDDGLSQLVDKAVADGQVSSPRNIQHTMDDILNRAIDDSRHILSGQYVASQYNN